MRCGPKEVTTGELQDLSSATELPMDVLRRYLRSCWAPWIIRCEGCSHIFVGKRRDAKTCCGACRKLRCMRRKTGDATLGRQRVARSGKRADRTGHETPTLV